MDGNLKLTDKEITQAFASPTWSERFPPVLSVGQVAELLQVPVNTIYQWRSRGLLKGCCRKTGKRLLFVRDRLFKTIFNEGLTNDR